MNRHAIRFAVLALLSAACKRGATPPSAADMTRLTQAATEPMTISYSPVSQRPSFMRGCIPLASLGLQASDTSGATGAMAFMRRHARVFGVDSTGRGLELVESRADRLGIRHVLVRQEVDNVPVYNAMYAVHIDPRTSCVVAVTSSLVPDIQVNTTTPKISADSARAVASAYLISGQAGAPRLMVYHRRDQRSRARLAWIVEVSGFAVRDTTPAAADTIPARRDVVVDATAAKPLDMIDRLYEARNRRVHDAAGTTTLPGTLARSEGQGPVADPDVNSAYQFLGSTYDYFSTTHGRDSYDNAGAVLLATVNYDVNYQNAFWNGTQMVFGDGFAVEDVTAHELTHAVTERTANLEYRWQSGALNESFSDIFGAMVDRADWLMGEDLPIGAIRDLQNPGAFGQPDNMSGWVATCADNEGVHTNSGIFNKAFVNISTAIGKNEAERIFYRTLTTPGYLSPQATMEDARGAAIQSAVDLFGSGSAQVNATTSGFAAVGLDGVRQPPANSCPTFPLPSDLSTVAILIVLALLLVLVARARAHRSA